VWYEVFSGPTTVTQRTKIRERPLRGIGVLSILLAACASPSPEAPTKPPTPKGPECGHGALDSDPRNCGQCGHDCTALPGVTDATCFQGSCQVTCTAGHTHCSSNPDDGCEADLASAANCGGCGQVCNGTCAPSGSGFACTPNPVGCGSLTDCGGGQCVDTTSDVGNCGGCGSACAVPQNGTASCSGGKCGSACNSGFALQSGLCVPVQTGPSWTPVDGSTSNTLYGVWGSPSGDTFIVGERGSVLVAPSGSPAVFPVLTPGSNDFVAVWGVDTDHVLGVGWSNSDNKGAIFRPQSDGTWELTGTFSFAPTAAWGTDFMNAYMVGTNGAIRHATDGHSWNTETSGTTNELWGIWGSGPSDVYAVGDKGTILHDKSGTWTAETSGTSGTLYGVWGASASDVWAVGEGGTILHSAGDGKWAPEMSGSTNVLYNLGGAAGDVYTVGDNGTILHRGAGGWKSEDSGTSEYLLSVWVSASSVWAVGHGGTILLRQ
jgi:hypothetical protein